MKAKHLEEEKRDETYHVLSALINTMLNIKLEAG